MMVNTEQCKAKPGNDQQARRDVPSREEDRKKGFLFPVVVHLLLPFRGLQCVTDFVLDVFLCQMFVAYRYGTYNLHGLAENSMPVFMLRRPFLPHGSVFGTSALRPASECGIFEEGLQ